MSVTFTKESENLIVTIKGTFTFEDLKKKKNECGKRIQDSGTEVPWAIEP